MLCSLPLPPLHKEINKWVLWQWRQLMTRVARIDTPSIGIGWRRWRKVSENPGACKMVEFILETVAAFSSLWPYADRKQGSESMLSLSVVTWSKELDSYPKLEVELAIFTNPWVCTWGLTLSDTWVLWGHSQSLLKDKAASSQPFKTGLGLGF